MELSEIYCDKSRDKAGTSVVKGGAERTCIEGVDSVLFVLEQDIEIEEKSTPGWYGQEFSLNTT